MTKLYMYEGDVVKLKQEIPNSPEMIVEEVQRIAPQPGDKKHMTGIRCFWFTDSGEIQKNKFDFKDLRLVKRATEYDN